MSGSNPLNQAEKGHGARERLRRIRWLQDTYANLRFGSSMIRQGYVAAKLESMQRGRARGSGQSILRWEIDRPEIRSLDELAACLKERGVIVNDEGRHTLYLPPQPALQEILPDVVAAYPEGAGFKILRDARAPELACYLTGRSRLWVRRLLEPRPRDYLISANYLHANGLGPRLWDLSAWRVGSLDLSVFAVDHVAGRTPTDEEWQAFIQRLGGEVDRGRVAIGVPGWETQHDFARPDCNQNLVHSIDGEEMSYVDFQNFTLVSPDAWSRQLGDKARGLLGVPGAEGTSILGAEDSAFAEARELGESLVSEGVVIEGNTLIQLGCGFGSAIHWALSAGCRWAFGFDSGEIIPLTREILFSRGATRFSLARQLPHGPLDPARMIPETIEPRWEGALLWCSRASDLSRLPREFWNLPWQALVVRSDANRLNEIQAVANRSGGKLIDLNTSSGVRATGGDGWKAILRFGRSAESR